MSISESQHNAHLSVVVNNETIKPLFEDKILIKSSDLKKLIILMALFILLKSMNFKRNKHILYIQY